jgi:ABC-2 type transport system permease protein
MNWVVFRLTLQQLLGRRRTLVMLLFALLPIVMALVARFAADDLDRPSWAANTLYQGLVIGIVLPLVALVFGTATLGAEFEDGTAVYLLTKPIPRWAIVLPKLLAAWLCTAGIMVVCGAVSGLIVLAGEGEAAIIIGFTVATIAGALVYTAAFLMLSILTGRALIIGLGYVFLWEGVITGLFRGTRVLSVREYTLAVGDLIAQTPSRVFDAQLGGATALALIAVATVATTYYGIRALERWEIGESG